MLPPAYEVSRRLCFQRFCPSVNRGGVSEKVHSEHIVATKVIMSMGRGPILKIGWDAPPPSLGKEHYVTYVGKSTILKKGWDPPPPPGKEHYVTYVGKSTILKIYFERAVRNRDSNCLLVLLCSYLRLLFMVQTEELTSESRHQRT